MQASKALRADCDLLIIGGGAAGFAAAITVKKLLPKASVLILERLPEPLKKLRATGNGRCNLAPLKAEAADYHALNLKTWETVLREVGLTDALAFFETLGLPLRVLNEGYYPLSLKAESVVHVLLTQAERLGVKILTETAAEAVSRDKAGLFRVSFNRKEGAGELLARRMLLAGGGTAQPALGSDGSLYGALRREGFAILDPFPALDALVLKQYPKRLHGTRLRAAAAIYDERTGLCGGEDAGEIIFNKSGVSGIPVMQLSAAALACLNGRTTDTVRFKGGLSAMAASVYENPGPKEGGFPPEADERIRRALTRGKQIFKGSDRGGPNVWFLTDFLPQYTGQEAEAFWRGQQTKLGGKPEDLLKAVLPFPLAAFLAEQYERLGRQADRGSLSEWLKAFAFPVEAGAGFTQAQVSGGGLLFDNLRENSLELQAWPGAYAAGELLDIYGDCGGYNLLWAWSSGIYAAREIAAGLKGAGNA